MAISELADRCESCEWSREAGALGHPEGCAEEGVSGWGDTCNLRPIQVIVRMAETITIL